jgi:hypothetical protein
MENGPLRDAGGPLIGSIRDENDQRTRGTPGSASSEKILIELMIEM